MSPASSTNVSAEAPIQPSNLNGLLLDDNMSTIERLETNYRLPSFVQSTNQLENRGATDTTLDPEHVNTLAQLKAKGNQRISSVQSDPFFYSSNQQPNSNFQGQPELLTDNLEPQIPLGGQQVPFTGQILPLPPSFAPYPSPEANNAINNETFSGSNGAQAGGIDQNRFKVDPASFAYLNNPPQQIVYPNNAANNIVATIQKMGSFETTQSVEQKTYNTVKLTSQNDEKDLKNKSTTGEPATKKIFRLFKNSAFSSRLKITQDTLNEIRMKRSQNQDKPF